MTTKTEKSPSAVAQLDRKEATAAYLKAVSGQTLTDRERKALKRYEKEREEQLRWQYYVAIPQKHWRAMSGRQTKVLNEQAKLYGIPFGGPAVSLPDVVKALHDFLATNARKLAASDDPMMNGDPTSPALERYREERYALARLDRLEREQQLVPRDQVREGLGRIAAVLRGAGEILQREYGPGALEIMNEALADLERQVGSWLEPGDCREGAADAGTSGG